MLLESSGALPEVVDFEVRFDDKATKAVAVGPTDENLPIVLARSLLVRAARKHPIVIPGYWDRRQARCVVGSNAGTDAEFFKSVHRTSTPGTAPLETLYQVQLVALTEGVVVILEDPEGPVEVVGVGDAFST